MRCPAPIDLLFSALVAGELLLNTEVFLQKQNLTNAAEPSGFLTLKVQPKRPRHFFG